MPAERMSMRRVREILRLKHECGATDRAIARSLRVARSTVAVTLDRLAAAEPCWPLPATLSDPAPTPSAARDARPSRIGRTFHHELRRPGVTLMLLWEEYQQAEPDGYDYSRWSELYRGWEGRLSPTMRQSHPAGERMFVDYAGQTVELYDGHTGEIRAASLIKAIAKAQDFNEKLLRGGVAKFADLAKSEKLHRSYYSQVLRLAYLAPDITTVILEGRQPSGLTATMLIEYPCLPLSWQKQRAALGFA